MTRMVFSFKFPECTIVTGEWRIDLESGRTRLQQMVIQTLRSCFASAVCLCVSSTAIGVSAHILQAQGDDDNPDQNRRRLLC